MSVASALCIIDLGRYAKHIEQRSNLGKPVHSYLIEIPAVAGLPKESRYDGATLEVHVMWREQSNEQGRHFELLAGLLFYGLPSKLCLPGLSGQQRSKCQVKNIIKLMKPDVEPDKMIEYVRNRPLDSSMSRQFVYIYI